MTEATTAKFRDRDSFNTLQMEAALCAWEWMCENREHELIGPFFEALGSAAMRHCSMQAGDIARRVHAHMVEQGYEYADAYDWEFVPSVLLRIDWKALTEDNQYSGEPYEPDLHAIFCAMVAADKAHRVVPSHRAFVKTHASVEEWVERAKAAADAQWGYPALIDDNIERVDEARSRGESPEVFAQWLGEKYDLTPRSEGALV